MSQLYAHLEVRNSWLLSVFNKYNGPINFRDYVCPIYRHLGIQQCETSSHQSDKVTFIIMASFRFVIECFTSHAIMC